jgi:hypothetical protein
MADEGWNARDTDGLSMRRENAKFKIINAKIREGPGWLSCAPHHGVLFFAF